MSMDQEKHVQKGPFIFWKILSTLLLKREEQYSVGYLSR